MTITVSLYYSFFKIVVASYWDHGILTVIVPANNLVFTVMVKKYILNFLIISVIHEIGRIVSKYFFLKCLIKSQLDDTF